MGESTSLYRGRMGRQRDPGRKGTTANAGARCRGVRALSLLGQRQAAVLLRAASPVITDIFAAGKLKVFAGFYERSNGQVSLLA